MPDTIDPNAVRKLLKLIVIPLALALSMGYGVAFYEIAGPLRRDLTHPLWLGMGLYAGLFVVWIRKLGGFWQTFEHELTHTLFALLFFQRIEGFTATAGKGGQVQHSGRWGGNFVISLAPYFFPTLTLVPLGVLFLVPPSIKPYVVGAVGFTLAYHLFATIRDARPRQPDLTRHGLLFSYTMIVLLNLICLGLVLTLTLSDTSAAGDFLARGLEVFYIDGLALLRRVSGI